MRGRGDEGTRGQEKSKSTIIALFLNKARPPSNRYCRPHPQFIHLLPYLLAHHRTGSVQSLKDG